VYNYSCEIDCNYTAAKSTTTTAVKSTATMAVKSILTSTFFEAVVGFLMGGVQITPTISTLSHLHSYGEIFLTVPPLTRNVTPVSTPGAILTLISLLAPTVPEP
jgi:hypothetical protein